MRLSELRMGASDLKAPTIPLTMGFEVEIYVSGSSAEYHDDNYDEFIDNYYSPLSEEDIWEMYLRDVYDPIESLGLKPYGRPTNYEAAMLEYEDKLERLKTIPTVVELVANADEMTNKRDALIVYAKLAHPQRSEAEVKRLVDGLNDSQVDDYYQSYRKKVDSYRVPALPNQDDPEMDAEATSYIKDEDGNIVEIDTDVHPRTFFEMFQNGDEVEDKWEEIYQEYADSNQDQQYEEWLSSRPANMSNGFEVVKDALDEITGYGVVVSDSYHGKHKDPDEYTLEPDSSISGSDDGVGVEIVSPVFDSYDSAIRELTKVCRMIENNDSFSTNRSTGLHVNIGFPGLNSGDIDLLKLFLFLGDKHILDMFGRSDNTYAQSYMNEIYEILTDKVDARETGIDSGIRERINTYLQRHATKYKSVNISKLVTDGYFEIRAFGGAGYHKNINAVITQINRFVRVIEIASNPTANKDEYLKKLYTLTHGSRPGSTPQNRQHNSLIRALEDDFDRELPHNLPIMKWLQQIHTRASLRPSTRILFRDFLNTLPEHEFEYWLDEPNSNVRTIIMHVAKKRGFA